MSSDPWRTTRPVGPVAALAGTALTVAALTLAGGSAAQAPAGGPTAAPTATQAAVTAPAPTATPTTPPAAPEPPAEPHPAQAVAADTIRAWQAPTVEQRAAALDGLADPAFIDAVADVDPADVPAALIASTALLVDADGAARVRVTLTDDTAVDVDLAYDDPRWVTTTILPAP